MKVDFVVVACQRDFELLKIQARSIAQYLDQSLVNRIWIIANDSDPTFINRVYDIKQSYGLLEDNVCIIDYRSVVTLSDLNSNAEYYTHRGWVSAQVARLLISRMIKSEWYINLDCKNILIGPVNKDTFFYNNQAKEIGRMPPSALQSYSWWTNSCEYLGFNGESISPQHCYSPFIFYALQLQNLINYSKNKKGIPLGFSIFDSYWHPRLDNSKCYELADIALYCAWLWFNNVYPEYYCNKVILQTKLTTYNNTITVSPIGSIHCIRDRVDIWDDQEKQDAVKQCLVADTQLLTEAEWNNFLLCLAPMN